MTFGGIASVVVAFGTATAADTFCKASSDCDASAFCPPQGSPWAVDAGHCTPRLQLEVPCYGFDACLLGLSCQSAGNGAVCWPKASIVELAQSVPSLSTFVTAVVAGDLVDILSLPGPFTVFAPTNEGFGKLPDGTVEALLKPENKAQLVDTLMHHVLQGEFVTRDVNHAKTFGSFQYVKTLEGRVLEVLLNDTLTVRPGTKFYDPSRPHTRTVTAVDNMASNGVIHIMDGVLLPSWSDSPIPIPRTVLV